jgi:hypothetical protein
MYWRLPLIDGDTATVAAYPDRAAYARGEGPAELSSLPLAAAWAAGFAWEGDGYGVESDAPLAVLAQRPGMTISPFQARAALAAAGLLPAVEALMEAPETPDLVRLAWEYAQEIRRSSPMLEAMAGALGLSEAEVDALFAAAAGISA